MVPADPLLVTKTIQEPSFAGAANVNAPPFVKYCSGRVPQSNVVVPLDTVPMLFDVTFAPPVTV